MANVTAAAAATLSESTSGSIGSLTRWVAMDERGGRQAWPFGSEYQRQPLWNVELPDVAAVAGWGHRPCLESGIDQASERAGPLAVGDSAGREEQDLAHAHPHGATGVGVDAGRVEYQRLDPESSGGAGDRSEVLRIVEALQDSDAPESGDDLVECRLHSTIGGGDRPAVQVEPDDVVQQRLVDDVYRCVDRVEQIGHSLVLLLRHQHRANRVPRGDQPLDGDRTLGDEELVTLDPPTGGSTLELAVVMEACVAGFVDQLHGRPVCPTVSESRAEDAVLVRSARWNSSGCWRSAVTALLGIWHARNRVAGSRWATRLRARRMDRAIGVGCELASGSSSRSGAG